MTKQQRGGRSIDGALAVSGAITQDGEAVVLDDDARLTAGAASAQTVRALGSDPLQGVPGDQGFDELERSIIRSAQAGAGVKANTCAVTAQGTPDMTVAVAAGTAYLAHTSAGGTVNAAASLAISAADSTHPRIDLVSVSSIGTNSPVVTTGTAAAAPAAPSIPGFHVVLATVRVPAGATAITAAMIRDRRQYVERMPVVIHVPVGDETTNITTGTAKVTFRVPYATTLFAGSAGVRASLSTAQTAGSVLTVDINEGGTTILSTKLTFDNNEKTTVTAATAVVINDVNIAADAEITVDVDTVGTAGAKGLKVWLLGTRA